MLRPTTEKDLAEAIASADGPLAIRGGGTGGFVTDGTPLTTSDLSGITLYEPGALTIVAKAGTPVAEVEAALASENQMLAFEPMDFRPLLGTGGEPTIGSVVATNNSGPRRVQAGACRDFLLGTRFVDGTGTIIKNGGRVMKNVTGYDLSRLMCGAHGTLGVLSEVSLKVLPLPAARATLTLEGLDIARAVEAMAAAMGSPCEVSGAAHDPGSGRTMLRLEGFDSQIAYRSERLRDILAPFGTASVETENTAVRKTWSAVRDVTVAHGTGKDLWRISIKPSDAPRVAAALPGSVSLLDRAGGLVWAEAEPGTDIRAGLSGIPGHAKLARGAPETYARLGAFQQEAPPLSALAKGLRARFDPRRVLNPGLMEAA